QNKISCQRKSDKKYLTDRHLLPTPRIELGEELIKNNVKCAIDVSDGLLADLKHICDTSFLNAVIFEDLIPISKAAQSCLKENKNIASSQIFSGGEDYELIFTAPKKMQSKILKLSEKLKIKITEIGFLQKVESTA